MNSVYLSPAGTVWLMRRKRRSRPLSPGDLPVAVDAGPGRGLAGGARRARIPAMRRRRPVAEGERGEDSAGGGKGAAGREQQEGSGRRGQEGSGRRGSVSVAGAGPAEPPRLAALSRRVRVAPAPAGNSRSHRGGWPRPRRLPLVRSHLSASSAAECRPGSMPGGWHCGATLLRAARRPELAKCMIFR
jgi:hypothetical protein